MTPETQETQETQKELSHMASRSTIPALDLPDRTNGQGVDPKPHVDEVGYEAMYRQSIEDPIEFWDKVW